MIGARRHDGSAKLPSRSEYKRASTHTTKEIEYKKYKQVQSSKRKQAIEQVLVVETGDRKISVDQYRREHNLLLWGIT